MFTSYSSSNYPGDDSSYMYSKVPGNNNDVGVSAVSRDAVYNGEWISLVPTTNNPFNHGSLDVSNGARVTPHLQREKDLQQEFASLKAQCNEKEQEIAYLKDKLAELENYDRQRENQFEQQMEETLQQLMDLKKAAFLANGNFMKKSSEFEELRKELLTATEQQIELDKENCWLKDEIQVLQERLGRQSEAFKHKQINSKEHEQRLNAVSSFIKKEVKNLRERLGQVRDEVTQRSVDFSQQAVQLQNLLIASKTGLTGNKGHAKLASSGEPCRNKIEYNLHVMHEQSIEQLNNGHEEEGLMPESIQEGQMSYKNMSYPLFRAADYFVPQPSEFDFLSNVVIANGPFYTTSLQPAARDEIYQKELTKGNDTLNPRPFPTSSVISKANDMKPMSDIEAEISTKKICNLYSNHLSSAVGYLNNRPLPATGAVRTYYAPKTTKASRYLNNRPLPTGNNFAASYHTPMSMKEKEGGFFGRTFNQLFGF